MREEIKQTSTENSEESVNVPSSNKATETNPDHSHEQRFNEGIFPTLGSLESTSNIPQLECANHLLTPTDPLLAVMSNPNDNRRPNIGTHSHDELKNRVEVDRSEARRQQIQPTLKSSGSSRIPGKTSSGNDGQGSSKVDQIQKRRSERDDESDEDYIPRTKKIRSEIKKTKLASAKKKDVKRYPKRKNVCLHYVGCKCKLAGRQAAKVTKTSYKNLSQNKTKACSCKNCKTLARDAKRRKN